MAEEREDIIVGMRVETAEGERSADRFAQKVEDAAERAANAAEKARAAWSVANANMAANLLGGRKNFPSLVDIGKGGFSMKIPNMGINMLIKDYSLLNERISKQNRLEDKAIRADRIASHFASRLIYGNRGIVPFGGIVPYRGSILKRLTGFEGLGRSGGLGLGDDSILDMVQSDDGSYGIGNRDRSVGSRMGIIKRLAYFNSTLGTLIKTVKLLNKVFLSIAKEDWKEWKAGYAYGLTDVMGSNRFLNTQRNMMRLLGGDAASVSALNARIASERAMIGYGGSGGKFMEAARLFGVNIAGSGELGLATNEEFMRNVAARMKQLPKGGQIALKDMLGLSDEMYYAMRGGEESYNRWMSKSRTLNQRAIDSGWASSDIIVDRASEDYNMTTKMLINSFSSLWISLQELGAVLLDAIAPWLTVLNNTLSLLIQGLNFILSPIAKMIGAIPKWAIKADNPEEYLNPQSKETLRYNYETNNESYSPNVNVSFGDVSLNNLGLDQNASADMVEERFADFTENTFGKIYRSLSNGTV